MIFFIKVYLIVLPYKYQLVNGDVSQKNVPFFAVYFLAIPLSILKIQLFEFICFSLFS